MNPRASASREREGARRDDLARLLARRLPPARASASREREGARRDDLEGLLARRLPSARAARGDAACSCAGLPLRWCCAGCVLWLCRGRSLTLNARSVISNGRGPPHQSAQARHPRPPREEGRARPRARQDQLARRARDRDHHRARSRPRWASPSPSPTVTPERRRSAFPRRVEVVALAHQHGALSGETAIDCPGAVTGVGSVTVCSTVQLGARTRCTVVPFLIHAYGPFAS